MPLCIYLMLGLCWGIYAMAMQRRYFPDAGDWRNFITFFLNLLLWPYCAGLVLWRYLGKRHGK